MHIKVVPVENPEEGWDDQTEPHCVVLDYPSREEVSRREFFFCLRLLLKISSHSIAMLTPRYRLHCFHVET